DVQADAGVVVCLVVPGRELLQVAAGVGQAREPLGKGGGVLQCLEPRLGVGVVVADPGPGVRPDDAEVLKQLGDRLRGHRRAAVGVQDRGYAVHAEHLAHHLGGQRSGLVRVDAHADDVPGVDVDHDVGVEPTAPHRAGQLGDVPGVDLPRAG